MFGIEGHSIETMVELLAGSSRLLGFHPIRVRYRHENSSAACASHKQENAPCRNPTVYSVIYNQSVHLGTRSTNRGPGPSFRPSPSHYWHRHNVFSGGDILVLALEGE